MPSNNSLSGDQLVFLSSVIASLLAKDLTADQVNVLGNFIAAVAASLLTIAASMSSEQSQQETAKKKDDIMNQIKELKKQLKELDC